MEAFGTRTALVLNLNSSELQFRRRMFASLWHLSWFSSLDNFVRRVVLEEPLSQTLLSK
jgi:hypothetical protein